MIRKNLSSLHKRRKHSRLQSFVSEQEFLLKKNSFPKKAKSLRCGDKIFTDFQKKVYRCIINIPLGQVRTYGWVAKKIKNPKASRAVGTALSKNPFTLLVPCHRVAKSAKTPGGYSLGKALKKKLINLEKNIADMIQ